MQKEEILSELEKLKEKVYQEFSTRKLEIINNVKQSPKGGVEGVFTKKWLSKILKNEFQNNVHIEGLHSQGKAQFKQMYFGAKPAPDFVIDKPYNIVGEVKYRKLDVEGMGNAIGKVLLYLAASKAESQKYDYGCIIFFDKSLVYKFEKSSEEELRLIQDLWEKENIFLIIV